MRSASTRNQAAPAAALSEAPAHVAVVTGAGRGIGAAIAAGLAAEGMRVALLARTASELQAVAERIQARGGQALALQTDITDARQVEAAVASVAERLGVVDVLVNNAGVVIVQPLVEMRRATWERVIGTNLTGAFLCCRAVLPGMLRKEWGRVINIASISGRVGTPKLTAYCASKWGLLGFTKALAEEVRQASITVNAICPGSVDTAMLRQSRPGERPDMEPDDIADAVCFLASERAKRITGAVIDIFGAQSL
ncbi:MAG: SDR family oxidoreductase [Candidatus Tectomicrobia bacterium]|nr:SDR family oxidoreductase [Candidatus Tectomicrobia bacterium]